MGGSSGPNAAEEQSLALQRQQQDEANRQAALASRQQVQSIQSSVSTDTWNLLKQFGARAAAAGSTISTPLSNTTGGFANPPATPLGFLKGGGFAGLGPSDLIYPGFAQFGPLGTAVGLGLGTADLFAKAMTGRFSANGK
jgi:hypothetical protein